MLERLVVDEPVPGCPLESVELCFERLQLRFRDQDEEKNLSLRVFFPETVDGGRNYFDGYMERLVSHHGLSRGEEREYYDLIFRMMLVRGHEFSVDRRFIRKFDLRTLDAHEMEADHTVFDELRETIQARGLPSYELMDQLVRDVRGSIPELLERAIYEDPEISSPLSWRQYCDFRESLIEEILDARRSIDGLVQQELKVHAREIRNLASVSADEKRAMLQKLWRPRHELLDRGMVKIMETCYQYEADLSTQFDDLIARARSIHDGVSVHMRAVGLIGDDDCLKEDEQAIHNILERHLDVAAVDGLLESVMKSPHQSIHGNRPYD